MKHIKLEKKRSRGKPQIATSDYLRKCRTQIAKLDSQMASINDRKNPEWLRLRKQKIAYQARLRNRETQAKIVDQTVIMEKVIEKIVSEAVQLIPAEKL